jgi:glycine/sarcosine N-methyltransferase
VAFGTGATGAHAVEPAADYDRFVDWRKRLEREGPFFRRQFETHGVRRVIDVGSGSGMHAVMWATWGLEVIGVDPDESMRAQAEINAAAAADEIARAGGSVRFVAGGFGELASLGLGPADAVTCTGNALPHIAGLEALAPTVQDFASVLRPGGIAVLHLLNHARLIEKGVRSIPPVVREADDGTWVFLRVMDYTPGGIRFDFLTLHRPAGAWENGAEWETTSRRSVHTALPSSALRGALVGAGFEDVSVFGDHTGRPLDAEADESLIVLAVRSQAGGFATIPA